MDKDKGKRLNEIFFNELGGMDNFLKAWKVYAKEYKKVKTDTKQDFIPTLESMKAYLQAQGLILPKKFNQFWKWFVLKYSDELDEKGLIEITQGMINDFSRERTDELKQGIQPTTTGTSPQAELETTEQKIKRILEPLRGAFDTTGHIDKIVKALAEYADSNTLPGLVETKIIQVNNPDFYPYFKKVKNETRLTVPGIALVLKFFICKNNGTGGDLETSTIEKNIKLNYKIVPE